MAKNLDYYKKLLMEESKRHGIKSPTMAQPKNNFDEVIDSCYLGNG